MTSRGIVAAVTIGLLVCVVTLSGCKKEEPMTPPPPAAPNSPAASVSGDMIEQTTCPVMGGAIDKNVFVEYQGKKVYFCCAQCKGEFEKSPEKYLGKLPQFSQ